MNDKQKIEAMVEIAERAEILNLLMTNKLSLVMDLDCATEQFDLRLTELLETDNFNFSHDIVGIQKNINRETKKIEGLFIPRFASPNIDS